MDFVVYLTITGGVGNYEMKKKNVCLPVGLFLFLFFFCKSALKRAGKVKTNFRFLISW